MIEPDYGRYGKNLKISSDGHVLTVMLDNPEKLNANTDSMHWGLSRIWDDIDADPNVRCVVLTGAGERAFSAGGDPAQMLSMADDHAHWFNVAKESKRIVIGMLSCDKPIVARINGHAIGFGATLALACDLIVGVENAKFGDPHCNSGLVCGDGGALLWPQQIGYALAKEFLLTGKIVTMQEAAALRIINYAVPRDQLDAKVAELVGSIANGASRAIQLTKNVMNFPLRQSAQAMMDLGMANEILSARTEDHREAARSFLEKRPAKFTGR